MPTPETSATIQTHARLGVRVCLQNGWRGRLARPGRRPADRNCVEQRFENAAPIGSNSQASFVRRVAGRHGRVARATRKLFLKQTLRCVLFLVCAVGGLQADVPAPNNLVYGTITLNGQLIGSTATNVVVEARRTLGGPAVASYRMGAEPANGNFYLLALQLEEIAPVVNPLASLAGQSVFLVVRDPTGDRANLAYKIVDRGSITRVDFGAPGGDSDQDGLPDAWELAQLGSLVRAAGDDPFLTGSSLLAHYIDGTDPKRPDDTFHLVVTQVPPNTAVTFLARQASGPGYEGFSRHYALESSTNLLSGSWIGLPNLTNILGDNSVFQYQRPASPGPVFFRGRVWLQSP